MKRKLIKKRRIKPKVPLVKKMEELPPLDPIPDPPRKRGRPRKVDIVRDEMMESNNSKGYTASEEEALKTFYRKAIELFKINSVRSLMDHMHEIRQYLYKSREFGQLALPFPPVSVHIEDDMVAMLRDKWFYENSFMDHHLRLSIFIFFHCFSFSFSHVHHVLDHVCTCFVALSNIGRIRFHHIIHSSQFLVQGLQVLFHACIIRVWTVFIPIFLKKLGQILQVLYSCLDVDQRACQFVRFQWSSF